MIYRSLYPDVTIPDFTLPELILGSALERGEKVALIDGPTGVTTTYGQLTESVDRTAAGLAERGFAKGEVAAIVTTNRPEFAVAFLAVARLGGITTPVNPASTEQEMAHQFADARPKIAFSAPEVVERVGVAGGPGLREIFTFGEVAGALPFDKISSDREPPQVAIDPKRDVVALPYSSGTTGTAKGVMLSHRNLVAMQRQMLSVEGTSERDITIAVLPFFHIYGLSVILLLALYRGATLVTYPRFEMQSFLTAIERHRVTRLPLVPPLILRLAREPSLGNFDLSSVRVVTSGAAPLPSEAADALRKRMPCLVKQGYGMTELSPGGHMHPEDQGDPPPGSVGLLHPNTECRLVDATTGQDAPVGAEGEIWYRGPQVMKGYLNRPAETAGAITLDGWLRTGDIGRIDDRGYLYVVDRLKELIKYKGFQVAPAELEALLLTHPGVADAAVIPSPDPEAGEVPKAFVVRKPGTETTEGELQDFVAKRVIHYKRIRGIEFVDEIPKSPTGKILRRLLVEKERSRSRERA